MFIHLFRRHIIRSCENCFPYFSVGHPMFNLEWWFFILTSVNAQRQSSCLHWYIKKLIHLFSPLIFLNFQIKAIFLYFLSSREQRIDNFLWCSNQVAAPISQVLMSKPQKKKKNAEVASNEVLKKNLVCFFFYLEIH